jgi:hypothetical protein
MLPCLFPFHRVLPVLLQIQHLKHGFSSYLQHNSENKIKMYCFLTILWCCKCCKTDSRLKPHVRKLESTCQVLLRLQAMRGIKTLHNNNTNYKHMSHNTNAEITQDIKPTFYLVHVAQTIRYLDSGQRRRSGKLSRSNSMTQPNKR